MMWSSATSFNPRTRVGCDDNDDVFSLQDGVSIHAPAWGATSQKQANEDSIHGFNPRTRVGCDPYVESSCQRGLRFNPRTRVGCDTRLLYDRPPVAAVSIHAPAWGATVAPAKNFQQAAFQSTHPRGVRQKSCWQRSSPFLFQSTHPRGVRPVKPIARKEKPSFQSTHPRGVRRIRNVQIRTDHWVSIHAPAWGATVNA